MMNEDVFFSRGEVEEFVKGPIWKEIAETIRLRSLLLSGENDRIDPMKEPGQILRNQGALGEHELFLRLPFDMILVKQQGGEDE
jgi:hypothetical protein